MDLIRRQGVELDKIRREPFDRPVQDPDRLPADDIFNTIEDHRFIDLVLAQYLLKVDHFHIAGRHMERVQPRHDILIKFRRDPKGVICNFDRYQDVIFKDDLILDERPVNIGR